MSDTSNSSAGEEEVQVGDFILYDIEPGYRVPAFVVDVYDPNMWVAPTPVLIRTRVTRVARYLGDRHVRAWRMYPRMPRGFLWCILRYFVNRVDTDLDDDSSV